MTRLHGALRRTTSALISLALIASGAAAADPKIENLKKDKALDKPLTAAEIEAATPMPSKEVTPEELQKMRERFRALNPGMLDLKAAPGKQGSLVEGRAGKGRRIRAAAAPYWSAGPAGPSATTTGDLSTCSAQFVGGRPPSS